MVESQPLMLALGEQKWQNVLNKKILNVFSLG
jgi:hypothetical protein